MSARAALGFTSPGFVALGVAASIAATALAATPVVFRPEDRAVSTWRAQAADALALTPEQAAAFADPARTPAVARCIKLNNYWCVKKAGWTGEIAADAEGHVAFATARDGAAVAALLLRRYYVDFGRHTALAIVSRWAPAVSCGTVTGAPLRRVALPARGGLAGTLRARWLAAHSRGFVLPRAGSTSQIRRSAVADRGPRPHGVPAIAVGLGASRAAPMTLDALLAASPDAPPSRSMIGMGRSVATAHPAASLAGCGADGARVAAYAAAAGAGLATGADGDLGLFDAAGAPTPNLAAVMANMARVEIGPPGAKPDLIQAGIAEAFRPGRDGGGR